MRDVPPETRLDDELREDARIEQDGRKAMQRFTDARARMAVLLSEDDPLTQFEALDAMLSALLPQPSSWLAKQIVSASLEDNPLTRSRVLGDALASMLHPRSLERARSLANLPPEEDRLDRCKRLSDQVWQSLDGDDAS